MIFGPSASVFTPNVADHVWATAEICCATAARAGLGSATKTITVSPAIRHIATTSCAMRRATGTLLVITRGLLNLPYRLGGRSACVGAHGDHTNNSRIGFEVEPATTGGRPRVCFPMTS